MSSESRRTHRRMIEPALSPTAKRRTADPSSRHDPPCLLRGSGLPCGCSGAAPCRLQRPALHGCRARSSGDQGAPHGPRCRLRRLHQPGGDGHPGHGRRVPAHLRAPVDVEVIVFEQNQYDEAVEGSFDTDKSPDVLYGDYFNISTYIRTGRVVPLDDVATPAIRDDLFEICGTWAWWRAARI